MFDVARHPAVLVIGHVRDVGTSPDAIPFAVEEIVRGIVRKRAAGGIISEVGIVADHETLAVELLDFDGPPPRVGIGNGLDNELEGRLGTIRFAAVRHPFVVRLLGDHVGRDTVILTVHIVEPVRDPQEDRRRPSHAERFGVHGAFRPRDTRKVGLGLLRYTPSAGGQGAVFIGRGVEQCSAIGIVSVVVDACDIPRGVVVRGRKEPAIHVILNGLLFSVPVFRFRIIDQAVRAVVKIRLFPGKHIPAVQRAAARADLGY